MPATHPEVLADCETTLDRCPTCGAIGCVGYCDPEPDGYDADEQEAYLAWLDSLPAGFPEPDLTPEREREILAAFGGMPPF